MDSVTLAPRRPLRPRGFPGLLIASLRGTFLSLPGLLVLGIVWLLVLSLAGLIAAVPVLVAGNLNSDMATIVGALMALVCLPFFIIWVAAGWGTALAWVASRTLDAPLGLGEALSLGVRRALPVLGTAFGVKLLGAVSLLPAGFLATAIALLVGQDALPRGPWSSILVLTSQIIATLAALGGLYICLRLLLAPWPALLEEAGPFAAIQRGWELSRGQVSRILLYLLLFLGLVALFLDGLARLWKGDERSALDALAVQAAGLPTISAALGALTAGEPLALGLLLASLAMVGLVVTLLHAGLAAFYFDRRRRTAGFGAAVGQDTRTAPAPEEAPPEADADLAPPQPTLPAPVSDEPWAGSWPAAAAAVVPAAAAVPAAVASDAPYAEAPRPEAFLPAPTTDTSADLIDDDQPSVLDDQLHVNDDNQPVDPQLDLNALQGISQAGEPGPAPAGQPRRSRLAWLWSWLPEPEAPLDDDV